jgi:2-haloalkanoic acid dehalogenase type II
MKLADFRSMTFDCYGTLVDWEGGIERALAPWKRRHKLDADNAELLRAFSEVEWEHERPSPAPLYTDVLRQNLAAMARRFGVAVDPDERDILIAGVRASEPFPDTVEALRYLKRHFKLGILSNIDNESLRGHTLPKLGIEWDLLVTAEDVRSYKPDPPHFDRAVERLDAAGIAKPQMLHLGQSRRHDCAAAKSYGWGGTVWVDRYHKKRGIGASGAAAVEPDLRVTSLAELVEMHRREVRA